MRFAWNNRFVLAGGFAVLGAGCTSLLGDFTQGNASDGGYERGATDATGNDSTTAEAMAPEGGGDSTTADAPTVDTSSPTDAGTRDAIADVVVHDGPAYAPPTEVNAYPDAAAGSWSYDPSMVLVPPGILVASDDSFATVGVSTYVLSADGGPFGAPVSFPAPTGSTQVFVWGYTAAARDKVSGNVYVSANGLDDSMSYFNRVAFLTSTNNGASFAPAVNAGDPALATTDFVDISSVAVDNASGVGQGVVYIAYGRYGASVDVHLTVVSNGAMAYSTLVSPPSGDQASTPFVAVGPNHYVYAVYYGATNSAPFVGFMKSTNQGGSFTAPATLVPLHVPFVVGAYNGNLGLLGQGPDGGTEPVNLYPAAQVACNPITGAIYVAYVDATQGADKSNIYFVHSEDTGMTWSTPVQVNDDTTLNDQFLPAMAVSPDGTRLAIDFYDRRDDPNNLLAIRYAATATITGATVKFDPNFKVSTQFPVYGLPNGPSGNEFSIHSGMAADATHFYDVFTDATIGTLKVRVARYGILF